MLIAIAISISSGSLSSCSKENEDSPVTPPVEVAKPIIQTVSVNKSNYDSVIVTGKIVDDGNSKITACGVNCNSYEDGSKQIEISPKDSGTFSVKVPIKFGVIYSFKAYAKNSAGTSYWLQHKLFLQG